MNIASPVFTVIDENKEESFESKKLALIYALELIDTKNNSFGTVDFDDILDIDKNDVDLQVLSEGLVLAEALYILDSFRIY